MVRPASRRPRGSLDRATVATAALELIETRGVEELTMRSLAAHIGCGTMTLYRYVQDRDDLLEAVVERLITELDVPSVIAQSGDDWRVGFQNLMSAYRELAFRRPRAFELLALAPYESGPVLPHLEQTVSFFQQTGLSEQDSLLLLSLADAFSTGFLAVWVRSKDSGHHPVLGNMHNLYTFERGLAVVLAGFERLLEAPASGV